MRISKLMTLMGLVTIGTAQMLRGVNWGHRIGQTWDDAKDCKPADRIEAEFAKIATYAQAVKIYSCGECLAGPQTLKYAKQFNLKVFLGVTADPQYFPGDFQVLKDMDATYGLDIVLGLSVGTEDLYRGDVPAINASSIVDQIKQVQAYVKSRGYSFPITHVDAIGATDPRWGDIRSVQDIYMYNYFPFWMGVNVNGALPTTIGAYNDIKANYAQGKPVWIGEVGWPSAGYNKGDAMADEASAGQYLRDFVCWANSNGVPYFYYEMFDEPWKNPAVGPTGPIEANFGIFNVDRSSKSYSIFQCDGTSPVEPLPQPTTGAPITSSTTSALPAPTTSSAAPVATSSSAAATSSSDAAVATSSSDAAAATSSSAIAAPTTSSAAAAATSSSVGADTPAQTTLNTMTADRLQGSASTLAISFASVIAVVLFI